jgi:hypothetical protein
MQLAQRRGLRAALDDQTRSQCRTYRRRGTYPPRLGSALRTEASRLSCAAGDGGGDPTVAALSDDFEPADAAPLTMTVCAVAALAPRTMARRWENPRAPERRLSPIFAGPPEA